MIYTTREIKDATISEYNENRQKVVKQIEDIKQFLSKIGYTIKQKEIAKLNADSDKRDDIAKNISDDVAAIAAKKFELSPVKSLTTVITCIEEAADEIAKNKLKQNKKQKKTSVIAKFDDNTMKDVSSDLSKINAALHTAFHIDVKTYHVLKNNNISVLTNVEELIFNKNALKCTVQIVEDMQREYNSTDRHVLKYRLFNDIKPLFGLCEIDTFISTVNAMNITHPANNKVIKIAKEMNDTINNELSLYQKLDTKSNVISSNGTCYFLKSSDEKKFKESNFTDKPTLTSSKLVINFIITDSEKYCYIADAENELKEAAKASDKLTVEKFIEQMKKKAVCFTDNEVAADILSKWKDIKYTILEDVKETGRALKETGKNIAKGTVELLKPGRNSKIGSVIHDAKTYCLKCTFKISQLDEPDTYDDKYTFNVVDVTSESKTYEGCTYCADPIVYNDGNVNVEMTVEECIKEILKDFANAECIDISEVIDNCCRHDSSEHEFTCCLCGHKTFGYGNNPAPLKDEGECCDACNFEKVIPARMKGAK